MNTENFHPAELDATTLKDIQLLEHELDVVLVALEPDPEPARLNQDQLARIRALEAKTGKVLVAYQH
ncbi:MAG: hypothetical protein HRU21_07505 [Pseudomonadales bacterium]|nr:hypothetical protein [Pseudomonadales bacterium]